MDFEGVVKPLAIRAKSLGGIVVFSFFFIYISVIPIEGETQPLFSVFLAIIASLIVLFKRRLLVPFQALLAIILVVAIFIHGILLKGDVLSLVKYSIGPLVLLSLIFTKPSAKDTFFRPLIVSLVGLSLLLSFSLFQEFHAFFIPRSSSSFNAGQLPILVPEQSYFVYFLSLLVINLEALILNDKNLRFKNLYRIALIGLGVFVGSLLVSVVTTIYLVYLLRSRKKFLLLSLLSTIIFVVSSDNRINRVIDNVDWSSLDIAHAISAAMLVEPSGSTRVLLNILAVKESTWTGHGSGSQLVYGPTTEVLGVRFGEHEVLSRVLGAEPQTYIFNFLYDFGLLVLLFLFVALYGVRKSFFAFEEKPFLLLVYSILLIFGFFQAAITNPIPWFLVYIIKYPQFYISKF